MDKDGALRLALEALENWLEFDPENFGEVDKKAITAIKAALEAKDEPMHPDIKKLYEDYFDKCFRESSPPQRTWVGLTDKERREVWDSCERQTPTTYVKAIEAKLKEKNTTLYCGHEETIVKGSLVHCKKCDYCFGVD